MKKLMEFLETLVFSGKLITCYVNGHSLFPRQRVLTKITSFDLLLYTVFGLALWQNEQLSF